MFSYKTNKITETYYGNSKHCQTCPFWPYDSPGKSTGVGCHFLQCVKVKSKSEVAQSCPTLCDLMDCSHQAPPSMGFSRQEYWSGVLLPSPKINGL